MFSLYPWKWVFDLFKIRSPWVNFTPLRHSRRGQYLYRPLDSGACTIRHLCPQTWRLNPLESFLSCSPLHPYPHEQFIMPSFPCARTKTKLAGIASSDIDPAITGWAQLSLLETLSPAPIDYGLFVKSNLSKRKIWYPFCLSCNSLGEAGHWCDFSWETYPIPALPRDRWYCWALVAVLFAYSIKWMDITYRNSLQLLLT